MAFAMVSIAIVLVTTITHVKAVAVTMDTALLVVNVQHQRGCG